MAHDHQHLFPWIKYLSTPERHCIWVLFRSLETSLEKFSSIYQKQLSQKEKEWWLHIWIVFCQKTDMKPNEEQQPAYYC
jgi:hypothetical protein